MLLLVVMQQTGNFMRDVLRKRPELCMKWIVSTINEPEKIAIQNDGRKRFWRRIPEFGNRALRVILLEDGKTVYNAFFDRSYKEDKL